MSILDRLFGKHSRERSDGDRAASVMKTPPIPGAPTDQSADTVQPRDPDPVAEDAQVAAAGTPAVDATPLRSLNRYRHDPAFKNFQERLKRPPGMAPRRRPNPDYPPPEKPDQ